ncbi:hypothetical protein LCX93_04920 [Sulfurimonas sp. SWIR-19]|uniref:hypothetical protein n=1 Tax=Sulfurimonas sp. SWIR-19 TaxID=2878390 RepID=UPI001CF5B598|nr:hypothetical protein [Sulfurimonas sp. SWIR-19]UCN01260.1 hypothetical protein LCX93_04920 [Sulfurimonas sp. SWIR-19]
MDAKDIASEYAGFSLDEVLTLAKRAKESPKKDFFIENDLQMFKTLMQSFVNKNNQKSEEALLSTENSNETMVSYAKNEQNLADLYHYLLLAYQNVLEEDLHLQNYQPVFYFDNYFVDFKENLQKISQNEADTITTHFYYQKLYKTTQDKLSIIYRAHLQNRKKHQEAYIQNRYALTDLRADKERYLLEAEILLDEFKLYANALLSHVQAPQQQMEQFEKDLQKLQQRFEVA